MNERDPFETLRSTTPFSLGEDGSVDASAARQGLFDEITTTGVASGPAKRTQAGRQRPRLWGRPALVAAAGFAAVAVFAGVLLVPGTSPSAQAAVLDASERVAEFESGRIAVLFDIREETLGPETQSGRIDIDYRFDGDNSASATRVDMASSGSEPEQFASEQRTVDGRTYVRSEFPNGSETVSTGWMQFDDVPGLDESVGAGGEAFGAGYVDAEQMIALIASAEDMTKVSSADGSTTYEGSIPPDALTEVPVGIGRMASDADASRPERSPQQLRLTVIVVDDVLASVALDAVGEFVGTSFEDGVESDIDGYADTTITTTYTEMGVPQDIEAPPADEVTESP